MMTPAFWDTSVLVPLCTLQSGTGIATELFAKHQAIVWWGTRVEMVSGLTRMRRAEEISEPEYLDAKRDAFKLIGNCRIVQPSAAVESTAIALLEKYLLRAADALQLAAAMEWCEGQPNGQVFLTADRRLAEAAGLAGFTLAPKLIHP